jgi:prepilin-type N-terminal cleavage/methylation domain-containing protein
MAYWSLVMAMKRRAMKQSKSLSTAQPGGFTLIEVLVVIIMVGVLATIAAPSWLAFLTNQRIGTARSQIGDTIRKAQDEAKRTKRKQAIVFDNNSNRPRLGIVSLVNGTVPPVVNWTPIGNGDIRANTIVLSVRSAGSVITTPNPAIAFDENGTVIGTGSISQLPAAVIVKPTISAEPRRCIVVQTLLGAMREEAGSACDV